MRLRIKVVPNSSRNQIVGWLGADLKVAVTAPAQADKANKAVRELFAEFLQVEKNAVKIIVGHRSSRKIIEFDVSDENKTLEQLKQYSGPA